MSTAALNKVEQVFYEALAARERGGGEPIDLGALCGGDAAVLAEVQELLRHFQEAAGSDSTPSESGGFLNPAELHGTRTRHTAAQGGAMLDEWGASTFGQRVGEFTLIEQIGAGAMGVVFVAEQESPRRTVALKLIRRSVATRAMIRRFEREAQLLGRLNHVGIAQVYAAGVAELSVDAGAPVRAPYLAMELVDGPPLLEFVRARQDALELGLQLMAQVCDAVQHAHQRGVIHRDLKPANILVVANEGGQSQVKVLDFGVARQAESELKVGSANDETQLTLCGHLIGTPAYMSPEQFRSEREVDARSDVYALGVILHQLLAGVLPIDVRDCALPEAARRIAEVEPEPLGSIDRRFRGDVETIVVTALQKDPSRRYQSPAEMARDIRHHLAGEPIEARRDSLIYVLTRRAARYRTIAWTSATLLLVVAVAAVYARMAAKAAVAAHQRAAAAQSQSERSAARLAAELSASRIDQGRLLGATGDLAGAERLLWDEYFAHPGDRPAQWALWQLYSRSGCLRTIAAQRGESLALSLSSDGTRFATGGEEPFVRVWSVPEGNRLAELDTALTAVRAVAFSRDGNRLIAAGDGGAVLLDVKTAKRRSLGPTGVNAHGADIASNDLALAVGSDDGWVRLFDPDSGGTLAEIPPDGSASGAGAVALRAVRFDPSGTHLAAAHEDGSVRLWGVKLARGSAAAVTPGPHIAGHPGTTGYGVDFSPDGALLASGSSDRTLALWRVSDGALVSKWETKNGSARSAAFSPDGKRVAVPGFWRTQLFDTATGQPATPPNLPALGDGGGFVAAFTPDGRLLITTGPNGICRIWDLNADPTTVLPSTASPLRDIAVARVGDRILLASVQFDGEVRVRARAGSTDAVWGDIVHVNVGNRAQTLALAPDAASLVVGRADGHLVTLDADSGRVVHDLAAAHAEAVNAVRMTPDGQTLISGGSDDVVRIWRRRADGAGWDAGAVLACGGDVINAAISPDGKTIAVTARPGNLQLWDLSTGRIRGQMTLPKMPWRLAWSPDGRRLAAGSWDRSVKVWDITPVQSSPHLAAELLGHSQLVLNEAFDSSGELLASVSNDGSLRIWDVSGLSGANGDPQQADRRRCLVTLEANAGDSLSVAFVPSASGTGGASVAVGYFDGTLRIWDLGYFDRHLEGQSDYQRALRGGSPSNLISR
jgi:WD40 repeat protein/serine/threonine protein kinase